MLSQKFIRKSKSNEMIGTGNAILLSSLICL